MGRGASQALPLALMVVSSLSPLFLLWAIRGAQAVLEIYWIGGCQRDFWPRREGVSHPMCYDATAATTPEDDGRANRDRVGRGPWPAFASGSLAVMLPGRGLDRSVDQRSECIDLARCH